jgi:hypothetical protein
MTMPFYPFARYTYWVEIKIKRAQSQSIVDLLKYLVLSYVRFTKFSLMQYIYIFSLRYVFNEVMAQHMLHIVNNVHNVIITENIFKVILCLF